MPWIPYEEPRFKHPLYGPLDSSLIDKELAAARRPDAHVQAAAPIEEVRRVRQQGAATKLRGFEPWEFISKGDPLVESSTPLSAIESVEMAQSVCSALLSLRPREERVIRLRFGIGLVEPHTLQAIASQLSVTPARARQIEATAIRKLKHPARSKGLMPIYESMAA